MSLDDAIADIEATHRAHRAAAPLDLDAIRRRVEAATAGPWTALTNLCDCVHPCDCGPYAGGLRLPTHTTKYPDDPCTPSIFDDHRHTATEIHDLTVDTLNFIAHARTDVPALLAEVDRLRAEWDRLVGERTDLLTKLTAPVADRSYDARIAAVKQEYPNWETRDLPAGEEDERNAAAEAERLAALRARIEREAKRSACTYTRGVIDRATAMLDDMYAAAARHGVSADDLGNVASMASACLNSMSIVINRAGRGLPAAEARALLDAVVDACNVLDPPVPAVRVGQHVEVGIIPPGCRHQLLLLLDGDLWRITLDRDGTTPVALLSAGVTLDDARQVAELLADLGQGKHGNPFVVR